LHAFPCGAPDPRAAESVDEPVGAPVVVVVDLKVEIYGEKSNAGRPKSAAKAANSREQPRGIKKRSDKSP
jgi:hypothetical protein